MNIKELLAKIKTDKKAFLIALSLLAGAVIVIAGAVIALVLLTGDGGQPDVSGGGSAAGSRPENASSNAYVSERFPSIDTSKIRIEGGTLYAIKGLKVGDLKTALDYQGTGEIQIKNTADVTMGDDDLLVTGMRLDVVEEGAVAVSYTIEVLESSDIGDASLPEQNGGSSPGGDGSSSKPQGGASGSETPENPTESQGDGNVNTQPTADKYLGGHSVRDYGAKGDGKTDDTEAINNAINHSMADGMPVYFPSGTYLVKRQIMMTNGVTFYGKRVSDIQKEADSLPTLLIDQTSGPGLVFTAGGAINGIQVKYNAGHASKEPAILCNAPGTRITNVVITNAYTGIEYEQSGNQNPGRGCIENVIINSPSSSNS